MPCSFRPPSSKSNFFSTSILVAWRPAAAFFISILQRHIDPFSGEILPSSRQVLKSAQHSAWQRLSSSSLPPPTTHLFSINNAHLALYFNTCLDFKPNFLVLDVASCLTTPSHPHPSRLDLLKPLAFDVYTQYPPHRAPLEHLQDFSQKKPSSSRSGTMMKLSIKTGSEVLVLSVRRMLASIARARSRHATTKVRSDLLRSCLLRILKAYGRPGFRNHSVPPHFSEPPSGHSNP